MSTLDSVDPSTPHHASPSIALHFKNNSSTLRSSSATFAIPTAPEEQNQNSEIVKLSPPSTSRQESAEDFIAIPQQLFQSPSFHTDPERSIYDIYRKDGYTSSPCLLMSAVEEGTVKNK